MGFRVLAAEDAFWRPSNQMGVMNTNLAGQLQAPTLGMRLWRLGPGQSSTRHRHRSEHELYVLLEGTGRIRVDGELITLTALSSVLVEPESIRQVFNDTDADALWLVAGAPPEAINPLEIPPELFQWMYPDGPKALPPELDGTDSQAG
ncbi:MAG TPA: cupin domain-containing protein [Solirubrobacteraceae bacterium]|jgi:quercetin dioxygenase-like cupin family protein|nr:cupin domain-containing protein [Solirubrobacteraceae bacterium]